MLLDDLRTYAVRDVRLVTPGGLIEGAHVVVRDGRIDDVGTGVAPRGAVDGRDLLLLPGLVDTHSDGLEKERSPRRTVTFPLDFAVRSFEGRVAAAGITTVFHGIGIEERPRIGRSLRLAVDCARAVHERRSEPHVAVDHRLLVRTEARSHTGVEPALEWIERFSEATADGTVPPLLSFEDHTPGQGQYRDVDQFRAAIDPDELDPGETVDDAVERILEEAEQARHLRAVNRDALAALAGAGRILLLAHDCEDADDVEAAHDAGASVAEFPLSVEAARRARELGMKVVMGAPNALRGGSHSGNVAAAELVRSGLCDALASDYLPSTMLAAAFHLARSGACSLHDAVSLVTSGAAAVTGLRDRGRVVPGARADLVLVDDARTWPQVVAIRSCAEPVAADVQTGARK